MLPPPLRRSPPAFQNHTDTLNLKHQTAVRAAATPRQNEGSFQVRPPQQPQQLQQHQQQPMANNRDPEMGNRDPKIPLLSTALPSSMARHGIDFFCLSLPS